MKTLRSYQREAVERIYKFFNSDLNKAKICMSTGLGKTAIIASAIDKILEKHDKEQKILIAVLTSQRAICEQIKNVLVETNPHFNIALYIKEMIGAKILITTYQDVRKNQLEIKNFDLIICDEAQFIKNENIWLTQKMMATLYDVGTNTINYHIKKIFEDSELQENSVIRKFRITASDGKSYNTNHYSLEMIIAVGFKVNSERAVQFRKWVNQIAKDYTIKGWVMDDERLKNGGSILTTEYFDRLFEQIREIRLSERRFYQKITDIYATALDYDRTSKTTKQFFAKVQNKMHYAVHGHTAAELIYERADADKPHMGLATWSKRLDLFLMADDREVLQDAGKITAEIAKAKAETEFEKYRVIQDRLFMSDFDKYMLELEENAKK